MGGGWSLRGGTCGGGLTPLIRQHAVSLRLDFSDSRAPRTLSSTTLELRARDVVL